MITFRSLLSLVVPSSILGISWFWWRWKNKELDSPEAHAEEKAAAVIEELVEELILEEQEESSRDQDIVHNIVDEDIVLANDLGEGIVSEQVTEEEITALHVDVEESSVLDFESMESDDVSPLPSSDQLSVDCDQTSVECESEVSPTGSTMRIRHQSSCGDSAIGDDYSSDAQSVTGSDSAVKSSEGEFSTPSKSRGAGKDGRDSCARNHREWYGDAIAAVTGKERPEKPRHWGSLPVSDSDSESECILKRSAKIGSVPLDKLSIQLNDELTNVKAQRESQVSRQRHPRQNRRRDRRKPDTPKPAKKPPTPKKPPPPKKNESSRKQRRKSNNLCVHPKKDDKVWRNDEVSSEQEEKPTGVRETVEFEFPDDMCGRLIGKAGRHIAEFKESTGVDICIECELRGSNRIVSITGISSQIRKAEKILNEKFHDALKLVVYPDMEEIRNNFSPISLDADEYDVIVTAVVDVGNFYVQVFHQDVDEKLTNLQIDLCGIYVTPRQKYMYINELPQVDEFCVSFVDNTWCRLKIVEVMAENRMVEAFFVDYGGYVSLSIERIWKMRPDMLELKPQAVLCTLHNVHPMEGNEFSAEASDAFYQLVGGNVLKATVVSHMDGAPSLKLSCYVEGGETLSISEQMHIWGLVDDRSVSLYIESTEEDSPNEYLDEHYDSDPATQCYEDDTQLLNTEMSPLLNHSPAHFICAS